MDATACVTEQTDFSGAPLPSYGSLFIRGHDVNSHNTVKRAESLVEAGIIEAPGINQNCV